MRPALVDAVADLIPGGDVETVYRAVAGRIGAHTDTIVLLALEKVQEHITRIEPDPAQGITRADREAITIAVGKLAVEGFVGNGILVNQSAGAENQLVGVVVGRAAPDDEAVLPVLLQNLLVGR